MTLTVPVKEAILFLLIGVIIYTIKEILVEKLGKNINYYFLAFIVGVTIIFIFVFRDSISNFFTIANFWEPTILKRVVFLLLSIITLLFVIILFLVHKSGIKF